jgi:hypothetical protein
VSFICIASTVLPAEDNTPQSRGEAIGTLL